MPVMLAAQPGVAKPAKPSSEGGEPDAGKKGKKGKKKGKPSREEEEEEEPKPPPPSAGCVSLSTWLVESVKLGEEDAASYAAALVALGVDGVEDLGEVEEGEWPSVIKPIHLKKIQKQLATQKGEPAKPPPPLPQEDEEDEEGEEDEEEVVQVASRGNAMAAALMEEDEDEDDDDEVVQVASRGNAMAAALMDGDDDEEEEGEEEEAPVPMAAALTEEAPIASTDEEGTLALPRAPPPLAHSRSSLPPSSPPQRRS